MLSDDGLQSTQAASASATAPMTAEVSFTEWLQRLRPALHRYMYSQLGTADAADDAVQETFLRMLRYRTIDNAAAVRALLFRVAASVIADRGRQAKSTHAGDECGLEEIDLPSGEPQPDRILAGRQELSLIKEAIRSLPPRCREVFLLHRFEGLSYREIAQRFGTSARTVENQIAHALAVCRRAIGERRGRAFK
jgi:RNA polymerase sigma factor (sigma-70 family)